MFGFGDAQSRTGQQGYCSGAPMASVSQYAFLLPYSRKHELEADEIGLTLMAQAGYDPSEARDSGIASAPHPKATSPPNSCRLIHPMNAERMNWNNVSRCAAKICKRAQPDRLGRNNRVDFLVIQFFWSVSSDRKME